MKIGKFKFNDITGFGPVYNDEWIDMQMAENIFDIDLGIDFTDKIFGIGIKEIEAIESIALHVLANRKKFESAIHPLTESAYLPPTPDFPTLFTMRGNGSLFTRVIGLPMPCHPTFELRYSHNMVGNETIFNIPENFVDGGWNIELVAVVGKGGRDILEENAYDALMGYTIMIDHAADLSNNPFENEWKVDEDKKIAMDNFYQGCFNANSSAPLPMGPWITTCDEIPDPHDLWITEKERNRLVSKVHTSGLLFSFPKIISFLSRLVTLNPGDMISSGSIGYDGYNHWKHHQPGDFIEVEVENIGKLKMFINDRRPIV